MTPEGKTMETKLMTLWRDRKLSGRWVRLKAAICRNDGCDPAERAVVRSELTNIPGGVVLKSPLGEIRYWNIDSLCLAKGL